MTTAKRKEPTKLMPWVLAPSKEPSKNRVKRLEGARGSARYKSGSEVRSFRTESDEMDLDSSEQSQGQQTHQAHAGEDGNPSSNGRMATLEKGGQGPSPVNLHEQAENRGQSPVVAEGGHLQLSPDPPSPLICQLTEVSGNRPYQSGIK